MKKANRILAVILTVAAVISMIGFTANAATVKTFEGYKVAVLDKTAPAVSVTGRTTDRNVMCFVSAGNQEVGVISHSDYNAIIQKNMKVVGLPGGGTYGAPPVEGKSWEAWFADEFNRYRELDAGSREAAVTSNAADAVKDYQQELVRLVNEERTKVGLPAYIINDKCMEYSQTRSEELVTLFSHTRPDGTNAGYEVCTMAGKNPAEAVKAWMDSPPHRAALLNETRTYVGAGVHITSNGGYYWQMYFERDPEVYANTLILG